MKPSDKQHHQVNSSRQDQSGQRRIGRGEEVGGSKPQVDASTNSQQDSPINGSTSYSTETPRVLVYQVATLKRLNQLRKTLFSSFSASRVWQRAQPDDSVCKSATVISEVEKQRELLRSKISDEKRGEMLIEGNVTLEEDRISYVKPTKRVGKDMLILLNGSRNPSKGISSTSNANADDTTGICKNLKDQTVLRLPNGDSANSSTRFGNSSNHLNQQKRVTCNPNQSLIVRSRKGSFVASKRSQTIASSNQNEEQTQVDKMDLLIKLLDQYANKREEYQRDIISKELEQSKDATKPQVSIEKDMQSVLNLEDNWASFVRIRRASDLSLSSLSFSGPTTTKSNSGCNKQQANQEEKLHRVSNLRLQQDAIWELLTTEADYIKRIKVILDLFLATLASLQQNSILTEIDAQQMSSNICDVYESNLSFWNNHLLPMLNHSRAEHKPLDPSSLRYAFVEIRNIFFPYYRYCIEHNARLNYVKEQNRVNELFKVYVAWCESQKDCERLRLTDLLAKPMQRLTRYSLLLRAIAKRTDNEVQLGELDNMIIYMDKFVRTVDMELNQRGEHERLENISMRIDSFDIGADVYNDEVDKLIKKYCNFDLTTPLFNCPFKCHRQLLFDSQTSLGQLKFKDPQKGGKLDIVLLIFTDQLLICQQTSNSSKLQPNKIYPATTNHSPFHSASPNNHHSITNSSYRPKSTSNTPTFGRSLNPTAQDSSQHLLTRPRTGSHSNAALLPCNNSNSLLGQLNSNNDNDSNNPNNLQQSRAFSLASSGDLGPLVSSNNSCTNNLEYRFPQSAQARSLGASLCTIPATNNNPLVSVINNKYPYGSTSSLAIHHVSSSAVISQDEQTIANRNSCRNFLQPTLNRTPSASNPSGPHLRAIRAPYPIERLVLHEIKDGLGVLCCQLNDSLTLASSFILYSQTGQTNDTLSLSKPSGSYKKSSKNLEQKSDGESVRIEDIQQQTNSDLPFRSGCQRGSTQQQRNKQQLGNGNKTPARQLIDLIREAQVRYKFAANFHGVSITTLYTFPIELNGDCIPDELSLEKNKSHEKVIATKRTEMSSFKRSSQCLSSLSSSCRQSLYNHHHHHQQQQQQRVKWNRKKDEQNGKHQHSTEHLADCNGATSDLETGPKEPATTNQSRSSIGGRSISSESQVASCTKMDLTLDAETRLIQRSYSTDNGLMKAIAEQHQSMLLNHEQHDLLSTNHFRYTILDQNSLQILPVPISLQSISRISCFSRKCKVHSDTTSECLLQSCSPDGSQNSVFEDPIKLRPPCTSESGTSNDVSSEMTAAVGATRQLLTPNRYSFANTQSINPSEPASKTRQKLSRRQQLGRSARLVSCNSNAPEGGDTLEEPPLNQPVSVTLSAGNSFRSTCSTVTSSSSSSLTRPSSPYVTTGGSLSSQQKVAPPFSINGSTNSQNNQSQLLSDSSSLTTISSPQRRNHLSSLRRQNVISSISSDKFNPQVQESIKQQQQQHDQSEDSTTIASSILNSTTTNRQASNLAMSTFDDLMNSNDFDDNATNIPKNSRGKSLDNSNPRIATINSHLRQPISFTLTLPNNDEMQEDEMIVENLRTKEKSKRFINLSIPHRTSKQISLEDDESSISNSSCQLFNNHHHHEIQQSSSSNSRRSTTASSMSSIASKAGGAIISKIKRMFTMNFESQSIQTDSIETSVTIAQQQQEVPELNVITATPMDLNSSQEFQYSSSSTMVDCSDRDFSAGSSCQTSGDNQRRLSEIIYLRASTPESPGCELTADRKRASSATFGEPTSSQGRFLRRCQDLLHWNGGGNKNKRGGFSRSYEFNSSLEEPPKRKLQVDRCSNSTQSQLLRNAVSDETGSPNSEYCRGETLQDINCIQSLVNSDARLPDGDQELLLQQQLAIRKSTAYLGFYEKLELHDRRQQQLQQQRLCRQPKRKGKKRSP